MRRITNARANCSRNASFARYIDQREEERNGETGDGWTEGEGVGGGRERNSIRNVPRRLFAERRETGQKNRYAGHADGGISKIEGKQMRAVINFYSQFLPASVTAPRRAMDEPRPRRTGVISMRHGESFVLRFWRGMKNDGSRTERDEFLPAFGE